MREREKDRDRETDRDREREMVGGERRRERRGGGSEREIGSGVLGALNGSQKTGHYQRRSQYVCQDYPLVF